MIKSKNYIVIQGWMISELGLKGNDLLAYALIYGFSQDGESEFKGSLNYIKECLGTSKPTTIKIINELVEKEYITKHQIDINGVKFNRYKINLLVVKNLNGGSKETLPGVVKNLNGGSKETLPNNYIDNYIDNNSLKERNNTKKEKPKKQEYGEYKNVRLTLDEYSRLCKDYGTDTTLEAIDFLDKYIEEKGYKSKSHNLAMRRWVFNAIDRQNPKPQGSSKDTQDKFADFDFSRFEV